MVEYRAYTVGSDGHFMGVKPLVCADDAEAIDKAKRLVNGSDLELWNGKRFVIRLSPKPQKDPKPDTPQSGKNPSTETQPAPGSSVEHRTDNLAPADNLRVHVTRAPISKRKFAATTSLCVRALMP
jgi:hypothetical protein